jgi:hypothetical protein
MANAMTIQFLLSLLLSAVAVFAALQRTSTRIVRWLLLITVGIGLFFVWAPDQSMALAKRAGITRGADLIFYTWVVLSFGLLIFLYLKIIRLTRTVTELARALALTNISSRQQHGEKTTTIGQHRAG